MRTRVDQQFREEARRYALKYSCEACIHYDVEKGWCSHGYPTEPHLGVDLEQLRELYFCKLFELG